MTERYESVKQVKILKYPKNFLMNKGIRDKILTVVNVRVNEILRRFSR